MSVLVAYQKEFVKKRINILKENNPTLLDQFQKDGTIFLKWVADNFDRFSFYVPFNQSQEYDDTILFHYCDIEGNESFYLYNGSFDELKI